MSKMNSYLGLFFIVTDLRIVEQGEKINYVKFFKILLIEIITFNPPPPPIKLFIREKKKESRKERREKRVFVYHG